MEITVDTLIALDELQMAFNNFVDNLRMDLTDDDDYYESSQE